MAGQEYGDPKCPCPISLVEQKFQERGEPRKSEAIIVGQCLEWELKIFAQGERQSTQKDELKFSPKGLILFGKRKVGKFKPKGTLKNNGNFFKNGNFGGSN